MNGLAPALPMLLIVLAVALVSAGAFAVTASVLRLLRSDGRLRLAEAMHGQGIALPEVHSHAALRALGNATKRCIACAEHRRCDPLLAAGDWNRLREICPNRAYLEGLRPFR